MAITLLSGGDDDGSMLAPPWRRPMPLRAVLSLLIAALTFACAAPAHGAPAVKTKTGWKTDPEVWGVNDREMTWNISDVALDSRVAAVRKLGAKWVRFTVNWARIQAAGPGTYRWTELDRVVRRLALAGIRWRPLTLDPPQWAKVDPTVNVRQPASDPKYVAEFLEALIQRYGTGGTFWSANRDLTARPVLDIELHNEPNGTYFWGVDTATWTWRTDVDGTGWAKLYGPALDRVKARYPKTRFWMGGVVTPAPSSGGAPAKVFISYALLTHKSLVSTLTGVAMHHYPWESTTGGWADPSTLGSSVALVVRTLRSFGGQNMQVQLNEFGASRQRHTVENRVAILRQGAELARSNCPIQGIAPFETFSVTDDPAIYEEWYDLVKNDGTLYPDGAAFAGEVTSFNTGKEQGSQLVIC